MNRLVVILLCALVLIGPSHAQQSVRPPANPCASLTNSLKYIAYLRSRPMDHETCRMRVENGRIVVDPAISNPSMSCADMFAWKLYAEVVRDEFWRKWAPDQYTWPQGAFDSSGKQTSFALPLCSTGVTPCCTPGSANNPGYDNKDDPAVQCPYFPGDHSGPQPVLYGAPPSKAHLPTFMQLVSIREQEEARRRSTSSDPGRVIRQSMSELVFRNEPMFDYVFENGLYHQQGIADVFKRNAANITAQRAPYRLRNPKAHLAEIDFPTNAIMIKSNWLNRKRAEAMGIREDPAAPFIKMMIRSAVTDNNGTILEPGEHWLVAFHISTKDIPNWTWITFEHVNNLGRCDYTGCSDSYGFTSPDSVAANQAVNYTMPRTKCDDLMLASWIYDTGKQYAGGTISPGLAAVLDALGVGTSPTNAMPPSTADRGWRSYRLKGSQNNFTDSMGRETLLGNSVTEGGFMTTSSCMSCHARATTTDKGTFPLALGVFINEADDTGYLQSWRGVPDPDWYNKSAQPPALQALQTDFVWGFLFATDCPTCPAMKQPLMLEAAPPTPARPRTIRERIRTDGQSQ